MTMNFTDTKTHKTLTDISKNQYSLRALCADNFRNELLIINHKFLSFDISKQLVINEIISNFVSMADELSLSDWVERYFNGAAINNTENRAVQHTALRDLKNLKPEIEKQLNAIKLVSKTIRENENIKNIIMIGIGGSDLGPRFVCDALQELQSNKNIYFVSNVDGLDLSRVLKRCDPDNTIIFILSKTFTTMETMLNARSALAWNGNNAEYIYAVTAAPSEAIKFGIESNKILEFSNDVGGRFSVWSSIGISIAIAFGYEVFERFLSGASEADTHFKNTELKNNMPFLMAVIGIWNRNYKQYSTHLMAPYDMRLRMIAKYIQQMDMESNGKSIDRNGKKINYKTAPQIYGEVGTDCQHSYMQFVHQGVDIIPVDFIGIKTTAHHLNHEHHIQLLVNMKAQAKALAFGQTLPEANNDPFRVFDGDRPSTTFLFNELIPESLGFLMALYEHKIFVQGIFWNLNSYDQPGVELGKILAKAEMISP